MHLFYVIFTKQKERDSMRYTHAVPLLSKLLEA